MSPKPADFLTRTSSSLLLTSGKTAEQSLSSSLVSCTREDIMIGKSILVVEDDGFITLRIQEMLTKSNYRGMEPVATGQYCTASWMVNSYSLERMETLIIRPFGYIDPDIP
jgi:PleD family two-component response regulator